MRRLAFVVAVVSTSACSGGEDVARCSGHGECLPGFVCEESYCVRPGAPVATGNCGPYGCIVDGPDETRAVFRPGALDQTVNIALSRASASIVVGGLRERSRVYRLDVEGEGEVIIREAATLSVPLSGETVVDAYAPVLWWTADPAGPWDPLEGELSAGLVTGQATRFGLFVAAQRPRPLDAGIVDGMVDAPDAAEPADVPDLPLLDQGFAKDAVPVIPDLGFRDAEPIDSGPPRPPDSGTAALPDLGPPDAGSTEEPEAGRPDAGGDEDTGLAPPDTGGDEDTGLAPPDTGGDEDTGLAPPDTGGDEDAGTVIPDSGEGDEDARALPDSGSVDLDATTAPDSGAIEDTGPAPDAGTATSTAAPDAGRTGDARILDAD